MNSGDNFSLLSTDLRLNAGPAEMRTEASEVCIVAIQPTNPDGETVKCLPQKTDVSGSFKSKCFE